MKEIEANKAAWGLLSKDHKEMIDLLLTSLMKNNRHV